MSHMGLENSEETEQGELTAQDAQPVLLSPHSSWNETGSFEFVATDFPLAEIIGLSLRLQSTENKMSKSMCS